jgi:hypothetical protein
MGDKAVIRTVAGLGGRRGIAIVAALSLAIGCTLLAAPASAQSLSDRFKSLFGGKSEAPAEGAPPIATEPQTDLTCPPVSIRAGASTYAMAAPG